MLQGIERVIQSSYGRLLLVLSFLIVCSLQLALLSGDSLIQLSCLIFSILFLAAAWLGIRTGGARVKKIRNFDICQSSAKAAFERVHHRAARKLVVNQTTLFLLTIMIIIKSVLTTISILRIARGVVDLTLTPKLLPLPQFPRA